MTTENATPAENEDTASEAATSTEPDTAASAAAKDTATAARPPLPPSASHPTGSVPTAPQQPAEPWLAAATAYHLPTGRPPVRWGGVVWGILLLMFAATTLFVVSAPARLTAFVVWLSSLTPGTAWALWIATFGLIIVVCALLGGVSAAQRRRRRNPA